MMKMKILVSMLLVSSLLSSQVGANNDGNINGTIKGVYNYSYIEGLQLYWSDDAVGQTVCAGSNQMTIRGGDANGKSMISMAYTALSTGFKLHCTAKSGCSGINYSAEANYCYMSRE